MSEKKGPWQQGEDKGSHFPLGKLLWLGLFFLVGILIWTLFDLFPEQASSEADSYLEIVRLFGILVLVSSGLIFARRIKFGEVVRNLSIWTGLAAILLLGYTYRTELYDIMYRVGGELIPGQAITSRPNELIVTASEDGHFYVNGKANGKRVRFMIDTGASDITLGPQTASRIGIDLKSLQFTQRYRTANGIGLGAPYWLKSFSIGSFGFAKTKVSINKTDLSHSLLGMSFLERLQSFEFRGDKLFLRKRMGVGYFYT